MCWKKTPGALETAQMAKCQPCQHKDLSLIPRTSVKKSWVWWWVPVFLVLERQRWKGPWAHWPANPSCSWRVWDQSETVFKNRVNSSRIMLLILFSGLRLHTHVHNHTCTVRTTTCVLSEQPHMFCQNNHTGAVRAHRCGSIPPWPKVREFRSILDPSRL